MPSGRSAARAFHRLNLPVVVGSPDPTTWPDRRSPPHSGDLRSGGVARSGDRATTNTARTKLPGPRSGRTAFPRGAWERGVSMTSPSAFLTLVESQDPAVYDLATAAPGPAGKLPLSDDLLRHAPSGDLFGW